MDALILVDSNIETISTYTTVIFFNWIGQQGLGLHMMMSVFHSGICFTAVVNCFN